LPGIFQKSPDQIELSDTYITWISLMHNSEIMILFGKISRKCIFLAENIIMYSNKLCIYPI
ncbi:MAG: hypothetical protein LBK99_01035, partial [Opitutaceae bacterium]|nr:hypothetical protein [Opitutaceae bacterium]